MYRVKVVWSGNKAVMAPLVASFLVSIGWCQASYHLIKAYLDLSLQASQCLHCMKWLKPLLGAQYSKVVYLTLFSAFLSLLC